MSKKENHVSKIYIRGLGLVETSPEHKKDYENECACIRMKMQYHGECHVTKANINRCDGIYVGCPFRSAGNFVSLNDRVQTDSMLTYADVLPSSEASTMKKAALAKVEGKLKKMQATKADIKFCLKQLQKQDRLLQIFDEQSFCALVDHITVFSKEDIRVIFRNGSEIKV